MSVLSLDVSASSSGWATYDGESFILGTIKTSPKFTRSERLVTFSNALAALLVRYKPKHIVIEDTFAGKNTKTLKILSEFAGVAKYTCMFVIGIEPTVVANTTVKSYYKARTKEVLFMFMCDIFNKKDLTFKKDNDIMDALAQLLYYLDVVLEKHKFKENKEYGFLFRSKYAIEKKD